MKKSLITSLLVTTLILPSFVYASWWNPLFWFRKSAPVKQQIISTTTSPIILDASIKATNSPTTKTIEKTKVIKNNTSQTEEITRLKQENEALKSKIQPVASVSDVSAQNKEIEYQKALIEQQQRTLDAQRLANEQAKQNCIATHYSKAQIQQGVDSAIVTLKNNIESSKASISSQYDSQIAQVKEKARSDIASAQEAQRGYASNTAFLTQIQNTADASIKDLESRKQALLASADANLSQQIADLQVRAIGLEQNSREAVCGL